VAALAVAVLIGVAAPALASMFTDAAGRRLDLSDNIRRVLPAERNAEVLVYVLAPDKLAGLRQPRSSRGKAPDAAVRPWAPRFRSGATPAGVAAAARDARADLIVDAGPVTPERTAFANAVQQQSGIPYVLHDDSFDRMPSVLRTIGTVLGVPARADTLRLFAENAIGGTRGGLLIRPAERRPRVYYGLGPDGLTTPLPGDPAAEAIGEAGGINVAAPLGRSHATRISRDQLLAWNPDIIIAQYPRFYDTLRRDRFWRRLSAVRNNKVYLEPESPFGWIDDPPGVNRLIGLSWLSALFYPEPTHEELRGMVCEFYDRFYRVRLTNARLNDILEPAGIPRPEPPKPLGGPSPGLGFAPGSMPPPSTDFGTAPVAPGGTAAARTNPVVSGTESGIPGVPNTTSLSGLPGQPDALCTIPGVASPIAGITGPGPLQVPGPGTPGRVRQPSPGGAYETPPYPELPPNPDR
jgi:iron complex transport system substrate-binding protein